MPRDDVPNERLVVAERLREARKLAGLSQQQAADLMGLHRPSISEIEAGRRRVSADEIKRFAQLYEMRVGWLLDDDESVGEGARVELAARELAKLSREDFDRVLRLLHAVRESGD